MDFIRSNIKFLALPAAIFVFVGVFIYSPLDNHLFRPVIYNLESSGAVNMVDANPEPEEEKITYLDTPDLVRAIYMTGWMAGDKVWRESLVKFVEDSELNSLVIDIKDYSGKISFELKDPELAASSEKRIPDIKDFIKELHKKNIYVIGRISVFQDPYYVGVHPDLAVKKGNGSVWKDRKGITWIDPAAREYWEYIVHISKEAVEVGFDELNFDYVRFPSDGNMKDIAYDFWDETTPMSEIMRRFFEYLNDELAELGRPLSVDLFGMVTTNTDDLNIGQVLELAEPYFDYIAPMVYPSHYPPTFIGLANPAANPYEVVNYSLAKASERLIAASSTPQKLRPWIQDFDLGADYDAVLVNKQKQALYDLGLESWMAWDASNRYTKDAY